MNMVNNTRNLLRLILLIPVIVFGLGSIIATNHNGEDESTDNGEHINLDPGYLLIQGDVENFELDKSEADDAEYDFDVSATGVSVIQQECLPPADTCEEWVVNAAPTTTSGTYAIGIGWQDEVADTKLATEHVTVFPVTGSAPVTRLATGHHRSFAWSPGGTVLAWGSNFWAELGLGYSTRESHTDRQRYISLPLPTSPLTAFDTVQDLAVGDGHTLALRADGSVWAWGRNADGELGDGTNSDKVPPQKVLLPADDAQAIAAGFARSLALRADGSVWGWGFHPGDGTLNSNTPVQVTGLTGVQAIALSQVHSLALLGDGTVWAWGSNNDGQLGDITNNDSKIPVPVSGLTNVEAIAAGGRHSLALLDDGTVRAWGDNSEGQLGNSSNDDSAIPAPVTGLSGVQAIAAGERHSLALLGNGTVWAWGRNPGDGMSISSNTPVQVVGLTGVQAIAAGEFHSLALLTDCGGSSGSVWAWGENFDGGLGRGILGDTDKEIRPVPVWGIGDNGTCDPQRVTFYITGSGSGAVTSSSGTVQCGGNYSGTQYCWVEIPQAATSVTLTAEPEPDSVLRDWRWDCSDGGSGLVAGLNMDSNKNCKLTFDREVAPDTPSLQATAGDGQVTLSWNPVDGATSYNLYWNETSGVTKTDNAIIGVTSPHDHTGLTNGTTYYYSATAVGAPLESPLSNEVFATPTDGVIFTLELQSYGISGANGNVSSSPVGIDCDASSPQPNICTHDFTNGTLVRLTAVPVAPSVFDLWTGVDTCETTGVDGNGFNYCEVTVFQDMSITAIFAAPGP